MITLIIQRFFPPSINYSNLASIFCGMVLTEVDDWHGERQDSIHPFEEPAHDGFSRKGKVSQR